MKQTILAVAVVLLVAMAGIAMAQPTLGPDCGTGATVVGTNTAGKITLGTGNAGSCTLTLPSHQRVCFSTEETHLYMNPTSTTLTTVFIFFLQGAMDGDTITYSCPTF